MSLKLRPINHYDSRGGRGGKGVAGVGFHGQWPG